MKLNIKKRMAVIAAIGCLGIGGIVTGYTEADKVSTNVSKEADNFNVLRRFAVILIHEQIKLSLKLLEHFL